jgi:hypothetical protein
VTMRAGHDLYRQKPNNVTAQDLIALVKSMATTGPGDQINQGAQRFKPR